MNKLFAAALALAALFLTACGAVRTWEEVIWNAGFVDIEHVSGKEPGDNMVYMATAGQCVLRFVVTDENRLYVTAPGSQSLDSADFVGDPSLALLKSDSRFADCFVSQE
ncbi:hypothetical protein B7Y94_05115 [Candidatus Saccharibacteria bacterium 32-49-12]|nr:MAG: hypothetical protein B7Y94_05115 [Candidatus Saccharibacteria bacterium 32-49-12]